MLEIIRDIKQVDHFDPNRVTGKLYIKYKDSLTEKQITFGTLENNKYLFPEGTYTIQYEYSPKFRKHLWEFTNIPNRTEIKFHTGNLSSHSLGCIILSNPAIKTLHQILNPKKKYQIKIQNK